MSNRVALYVFRSLLRLQRNVAKEGCSVVLRHPIIDHEWGIGAWQKSRDTRPTLGQMLPFIQQRTEASILTAEEIKRLLLFHFRIPSTSQSSGHALMAMKVMSEQWMMHKCSSVVTTNGLQVDVTSKFKSKARDENGRKVFLFSYRIQIQYFGTSAIQLESRQWMIKEEGKEWVEIIPKGSPGVVGMYPIFPAENELDKPVFQYTSGCTTLTPRASMKGCFKMVHHESDESFEATVAPFRLIGPKD